MKELLDTLGSLKDLNGPVVFYILDEHDKLYKTKNNQSPIDTFPNILEYFTKWTGITSGVCKT